MRVLMWHVLTLFFIEDFLFKDVKHVDTLPNLKGIQIDFFLALFMIFSLMFLFASLNFTLL
jgi:hypothetical protein